MKKINNPTVLLYINPDKLVVLPDGTVISGVRAEFSDRHETFAMNDAEPKPDEEFCNSHSVRNVWMDDSAGK